MRRLLPILLGLLFIILIVAVYLKPLVLALAQKQLRTALGAQTVSIQDCRLHILHEAVFFNVEVKKPGQYEFKAAEVDIDYNVWSLLRKQVVQVSLRKVAVKVPVSGHDLTLDNGSITVNLQGVPGDLSIGKLQYHKFKIENVTGRTKMEGTALVLDEISGQILNGLVQGGVAVKIDKSPLYLADLKFIDVDLARFVEDFDLKEKMQMAGLLTGEFKINGHGVTLKILNGNFATGSSGGVLTVKDASFLQKMARNTNQPLNIVVDSLKDYHYNTGGVKLHLDQGNLVLDMALQGEAGKRKITITLHDFNL